MHRQTAVLFLVCSGAAGAAATEPEPAVDAAWAEHRVYFHFFGNDINKTTSYSCDSIRDKLRVLLRLAGARSDVDIATAGCGLGSQIVSSMITADLGFHSPTLARPANAAAASEPVPAHWNTKKLQLGSTNGFDSGDCQLVEQFRLQVLKVFDVRNVTANLDCMVRQPPPRGRSSLAFEALIATATAEAESIARDKQPPKHDDQLKSDQN